MSCGVGLFTNDSFSYPHPAAVEWVGRLCATELEKLSMNKPSYFPQAVRVVTALALLASQQVLAAEPGALQAEAVQSIQPVDVVLGADGVMQGYVVSAQGEPTAEVEITLTTSNGEQVTTASDEKGRFGYRGLSGGTYQLETAHGVVVCRAWTPKAAPPRSAATLLLVHDADVVRGQWSAPPAVNGSVSRLKYAMTNPFFVATVVGAAVAIPVAIHNADDDDSAS